MDWGNETIVRQRLQQGFTNLRLTRRIAIMRYPFPPAETVEFFRKYYGPTHKAFESLPLSGQADLRRDLVELQTRHNVAKVQGTTEMKAEYLEVIATRDGHPWEGPENRVARKARGHVSHRAGLLADRIEEGAGDLASFAEGISEAEWQSPVSGTDRRSIGVIVHHVASMYPIEVEAAQAIAGGKPVTDVTWEVVANLNAKHAQEHALVTKTDALDLLRKNSREAASIVREFADDELDRARPFSLSFGAPVTAQFVIEDHALRHSWHHLARFRKALGR